jgi:23S rRNA (cytosine1962-C5)-methyltransferase
VKITGGWIGQELMHEFAAEKTNAHRFCTARDGWVERYGDDVLISFKSEATCERLSTELFLWAQTSGFPITRVFGRFLPKQNAEREASKLLFGNATKDVRSIAIERSLQYGVDFSAGYSVGLFLDQRENRSFVRKAAPKRMLNCFAYTCSFSVAAASAGANTLSVDLSRKSLERGRENFILNKLPLAGHRFMANDVFEVLPRLARRSEKFDMIILDPPTFSRSRRGRAFQVESDFERLLFAALEVAGRDTRILLSTNCQSLKVRALEVMARFCLKAARRAGTFHQTPTQSDFPPSSAARTIWLTLR